MPVTFSIRIHYEDKPRPMHGFMFGLSFGGLPALPESSTYHVTTFIAKDKTEADLLLTKFTSRVDYSITKIQIERL